jgi:hypothetical protein
MKNFLIGLNVVAIGLNVAALIHPASTAWAIIAVLCIALSIDNLRRLIQ